MAFFHDGTVRAEAFAKRGHPIRRFGSTDADPGIAHLRSKFAITTV
jgi:hypothetical protein